MREIFWYFLKLGWLAFGGPVGQIGLMPPPSSRAAEMIGEEEFVRRLNFCHVLPDPKALQLAIYIGSRRAIPRRGAGRIFSSSCPASSP